MAEPTENPEGLLENNIVKQFIEQGTKLLQETNRPNVVTVEEFMPFVDLFNTDMERYVIPPGKPNEYTLYINDLFMRYRHDLGINLHEVTYIIQSKEDTRVVGFLDRMFTRLASDGLGPESERAKVPTNVPRNASVTREDLIIDASFKDVVSANNTEEQFRRIGLLKMESAVITKNFTEINQSIDKRPREIVEETDNSGLDSSNTVGIILLDDDD